MKKNLLPRMQKMALLLSGLFCLTMLSQAQTMTVAPHNWILNAQGNAIDVLTIYGGAMPAGGVITGHNVTLQLEGQTVSTAMDFEYCYVDQNYIAHFEKSNLFQHPVVVSLAGNTGLSVSISGTYILSFPDGSSQTYYVPLLTGTVDIQKPGKKK